MANISPNRSQGLTLTASLKAAQVASDLQLIESTCATIVTRVLIQQALRTYYTGNTTGDDWLTARNDVASALSSGGYSNLLQVIIYPRNETGNERGLLNVTASTLAEPIVLPYTYPNGTSVHLGDPDAGYPAKLYPNLTYISRYPNDPNPDVYAFPDFQFNRTSVLVLGPLQVNSTFAMISMTLSIINSSTNSILGYMTTIADASMLTGELSARNGLGDTGLTLLIGPDRPDNLLASNLNLSNANQLSQTKGGSFTC